MNCKLQYTSNLVYKSGASCDSSKGGVDLAKFASHLSLTAGGASRTTLNQQHTNSSHIIMDTISSTSKNCVAFPISNQAPTCLSFIAISPDHFVVSSRAWNDATIDPFDVATFLSTGPGLLTLFKISPQLDAM